MPGWSCRYVIEWPHGHRDSAEWGHDSMQAITLTLQKIGMAIYASAYHEARQLVWNEPERGYGFPVPKAGRDLSVGDDVHFDG